MHYKLPALILDTFGTLMIAFAALRVHHRVLHEHKVDDKVFGIMQFEQRIGWLGVFFVLFSFILELFILFFEI